MKLKNIINTLIIYCFIAVSFVVKAQTTSSEDFEVKGFHLDLRIQVMTPEALRNFADELAAMGMNTLVMEWEGACLEEMSLQPLSLVDR